jgi:hypothetical protein
MSYDNLSSVSQNILKFYHQLTGEERRIPFIFDDFHFCCSACQDLHTVQFEVNLITHLGVIALFSLIFFFFISFRLIFQKR